MSADTHPFLVRLQQATNDHDLDALVDCFAAEYRTRRRRIRAVRSKEPSRSAATGGRSSSSFPMCGPACSGMRSTGSDVWSEWEMSGTRVDGTPHLMRGVIVFGLQGERAASARFYLEPVDQTGSTVDDAVRRSRACGRPDDDRRRRGQRPAGPACRRRRSSAQGEKVRVLVARHGACAGRCSTTESRSSVATCEDETDSTRRSSAPKWWSPLCTASSAAVGPDRPRSTTAATPTSSRPRPQRAPASSSSPSSGASADHPVDLFRAKFAAEQYLRGSGTPWTIVRPPAVPRDLARRPRQDGRAPRAARSCSAVAISRSRSSRPSTSPPSSLGAATDPTLRGRVLEVAGEPITMIELARALQDARGWQRRCSARPTAAAARAFRRCARPLNPAFARQNRAALAMDTGVPRAEAPVAGPIDVPHRTLGDVLAGSTAA